MADWKNSPEYPGKYQEYLASREWALKREAVRERSGNLCERCLRRPQQAVHHKTYANKYNEPLEDLQAICNPCHEFESGKRHADPRFRYYRLIHSLGIFEQFLPHAEEYFEAAAGACMRSDYIETDIEMAASLRKISNDADILVLPSYVVDACNGNACRTPVFLTSTTNWRATNKWSCLISDIGAMSGGILTATALRLAHVSEFRDDILYLGFTKEQLFYLEVLSKPKSAELIGRAFMAIYGKVFSIETDQVPSNTQPNRIPCVEAPTCFMASRHRLEPTFGTAVCPFEE